jgi:hypothetical protein
LCARQMGEKARRQQVFVPDANGRQKMIWQAI